MTNNEIVEKLNQYNECVAELPEHLQTIAFSKLLDHWLGAKSFEPSKTGVGTSVAAILQGSTSFGEFFAGFRRDIQNDQKLLISAQYVQSQSDDGIFTVRDANKHLLEHGIKLSNPSEFCRGLEQKGYVFRNGKAGETQSKWKVSQEGNEHIQTLRKDGAE